MIISITNKKAGKNITFISIIFFLLLVNLILISCFVNAQEVSGGADTNLANEDLITIEPEKTQEIGDYFGIDKDKVTIEVPKDSKQVNFNPDKRSFEGVGDYKITFKGDGKEIKERVYEGFKQRKVGSNNLVFDEKNELTEGTNFESDGGKENVDGEKEGREIDIKGYKLKLNEGDVVNIQKENTIVEVSTSKGLTRPEKIRDIEEKPEFKFISNEEVEIKGEDVKFKGTLRAQGDKFYWQKGDDLQYGGLEFNTDEQNHFQNDKTFIGNKIDEEVPKDFDSAVILDKNQKQLKIIANNNAGPVINFKEGNEIITKLDATDHFAVQAFGNLGKSELTITNLDAEGLIPKIESIGQFGINEDDKSVYMSDDGKIFFRKKGVLIETGQDTKGTTTTPIELIPYDKDGNLIAGKDSYAKLLISNNNQYATANLNDEATRMLEYKYDGTNVNKVLSSRVTYNYLTQKDQIKLLSLSEEKQKEFNELKDKPFVEQKKWLDEGYEEFIESEEGKKFQEAKGDKKNWKFDDSLDEKGVKASIMVSSSKITIGSRTLSEGSGTIVGTKDGNAIIITAGHLFQGMPKNSPIHVDIFDNTLNKNKNIPGKLIAIDYNNADRDLALISIPLQNIGSVSPSKIASVGYNLGITDSIITAGCTKGADCTLEAGRIMAIDKFLGESTIEARVFNDFGRSGGGMFSSRNGNLIGVCQSSANPGVRGSNQEGLYGGISYIQKFLQQKGYDWLLENNIQAILIFVKIIRVNVPLLQIR